jgi:hypothetical protein
MVVIRIVDEEICAFLHDNKAGQLRHELDRARLVPYSIVEIEGSPHKTDKQKALVDTRNVQPEA